MNSAADWYADQEQRERIMKTDTKANMRLIDANALAESDMAKLIDGYLYNQCNLTVGLAAALMPEIKAEPVRWIPVEDALPDSKEDVLVWFEYFRYGEYNCLCQTYGIGNYNKNYDGWMVNHETGWDQLRVIAWMPLPEPPEKE